MTQEHSHQNQSTLFVFMKNTPWYTGEVSYIWKALFKEWHRQPSPQGTHTASRSQPFVQFPPIQLPRTGKRPFIHYSSYCSLFPPETEGLNVEVMEWKVCVRLVQGGRGGCQGQSCRPSRFSFKMILHYWNLSWKHENKMIVLHYMGYNKYQLGPKSLMKIHEQNDWKGPTPTATASTHSSRIVVSACTFPTLHRTYIKLCVPTLTTKLHCLYFCISALCILFTTLLSPCVPPIAQWQQEVQVWAREPSSSAASRRACPEDRLIIFVCLYPFQIIRTSQYNFNTWPPWPPAPPRSV